MEARRNRHVLVLPFPVQGHINPMLQFSKRLQSKGLDVTLLIPTSNPKSLQVDAGSVRILPISDGGPEQYDGDAASIGAYLQRVRSGITQSLCSLLESDDYLENAADVLIYDSVIPWALDIARQYGIRGASFFTQSCVVNAVYYLVHKGDIQVPIREQGGGRQVLGVPQALSILEPNDFPSFVTNVNAYLGLVEMVCSQFSNLRDARWLFFNTFVELEEVVVQWMESEWPSLTVGPTIPSIFLDKTLEDDKDYGLSLFKPETEACITWLDSKEANSVAYLSFGSLAALGEEQMEEIADGLKRIEMNFLWIVRESEEKKLPSGFVDEVSGKGLVVRWCPQLQVLAHEAVSCFVTHCGWNSTLEALSLGVPMVVMPQWTDQPTNAKFIVDVWEAGVRMRANEKGIITAKEVETCINEVMVEDKGNRIRANSQKWKELARKALQDGGSSDRNIDRFIAELSECH